MPQLKTAFPHGQQLSVGLILPLLQAKSHMRGAAYGMEQSPGEHRAPWAILRSVVAGLHSQGLVSGEPNQGVS